ncbi:pyruvate kinase [Pseudomonas sp. DC3200b2]|uniref:pyruvate kinase n=1 Tax=Pseudomonas sp. DC3200b2 TaxID=2804669 RepID=UPI003CF8D68D
MTTLQAPAPLSPVAHLAGSESTLRSLRFLRKEILGAAGTIDLEQLAPTFRASAANLLGYLALRRHDIRLLQASLSELGLASLGHCESDVLRAVDQLISLLEALSGRGSPEAAGPVQTPWGDMEGRLVAHLESLFGLPPRGDHGHIMVTMPSEAADDAGLVEGLLAAGMTCQRINCAHDSPQQWQRMIEHLRLASRKLGKPCQVAMDLPGPKLRTGPIGAGSAAFKVKPKRGETGAVLMPARLYLSAQAEPQGPAVQVSDALLAELRAGDTLGFRDARGAKRTLQVIERDEQGCWGELVKTAYLTAGLRLKLKRGSARIKGSILAVPASVERIKLEEGDTLVLTRALEPGVPVRKSEAGKRPSAARIGCSLAAAFERVRPGEPVWFDDGKIGGEVLAVTPASIQVRITHAPGGAKLRADKGINFPDTDLGLDALGEEDLQALAFAVEHADIVQLSFANRAADVRALYQRIEDLGGQRLGVVLKIETRQGFEHLPELLLAGMRGPRFGVMIARGDLAVEAGFERTAELQEEILCLCEAAHVPVIWATQVLETQAKNGAPTRAEITDAAMSARAECVMLNKGPYILRALATLQDLLGRMRTHHSKKRDLMRRLKVADLSAAEAR